ncbi:MAG: 2-oxoglutarate and iron-dependent oxygenase domain-containing protein [Acidimicrobiia bacterium]|nr:2-oxoglutarate and iron-dependent oxygenase domain-containing protein [Acidimicrobiia bacterium]
MRGVVPTVDLADPDRDVAAAIDVACRRVGFFQILGHGIDPIVIDDAWNMATRFFDLPHAARMAVRIPDGDAYGYAPYRSEALAAGFGQSTPPDLKETFSVGPLGSTTAGLDDPVAAFVFSPNRWPPELPELETAFDAYYRAMGGLAARILSFAASALGLPSDFFERFVDRHTSALRALRYPDLGATPVEPGQLRAGAHSDYGTLTLLRQDGAPGGLQVRGLDGRWHDVPSMPGAFVVNVGDALERWSNDRWRSTVHRVAVPPHDPDRDSTRMSLAFFHNANWDAQLECLPTCSDAEHPARYAPTTAGRHLMDKFRSTQDRTTR